MIKKWISIFTILTFFFTTPVFAEETAKKSPIPYIIVVGEHGVPAKLDVSEFPLEVNRMQVEYVDLFQTEEELENRASVVLRATILPERESYYWGKLNGYTKTKIHVNEVYKGNVKKDSVISLWEPYFYVANDNFFGSPGILYELHEDLYNASEVGKEYIFFLLYSKNGDMYYPVNTYYGRYPVADKTRAVPTEQMTAEDFDVAEGPLEDYKKIYDEVTKRYQ